MSSKPNASRIRKRHARTSIPTLAQLIEQIDAHAASREAMHGAGDMTASVLIEWGIALTKHKHDHDALKAHARRMEQTIERAVECTARCTMSGTA